MLVNACNIDLTFYYQLSLTSIDVIFGASAIKSILQKKEEKKAEIIPQQKTVKRKPVLKHMTLRLVFAPWHNILEPYYTRSENSLTYTRCEISLLMEDRARQTEST